MESVVVTIEINGMRRYFSGPNKYKSIEEYSCSSDIEDLLKFVSRSIYTEFGKLKEHETRPLSITCQNTLDACKLINNPLL